MVICQVRTAEEFRTELRNQLERIFASEPNIGLIGEVVKLNAILRAGREAGFTGVRMLKQNELMDTEAQLMGIGRSDSPGAREDYWEDLMDQLRKMGMEEKFIPDRPNFFR